eukprot:TRINITY_DN1900_c0_g1_i3.p1 TRINITY_DN1900_c0_g1~~TRINITY_DN1900_c0_g1_i3.p1  ORF type:complete len:331 (-),score=70.93 TRINITY_DN1900_c0_g1_i3:267-1259(-)
MFDEPAPPGGHSNADDGDRLLQNVLSYGGAGPSQVDINFDMEWAFCSILEGCVDEPAWSTAPEKVAEKRDKPDETEESDDGAPGEVNKKAKVKAGWRKYGQKTLKGKDYTGMKMLRCYYRCNYPGCQVKKQVETSAWSNETANITINGIHNHPVVDQQPQAEPGQPGHALSLAHPPSSSSLNEPKPTPPLNQDFADHVVRSHPHFVVADPNQEDCPIIFASSGFLKLTGYSLTEVVGRNCRFLQGKDTNVNAVRQLTKAIKASKEIHIILLNYKKDGTPFWNLLHITPVIGADGLVHSIVGSQLDVSGVVNQAPGPSEPNGEVDHLNTTI